MLFQTIRCARTHTHAHTRPQKHSTLITLQHGLCFSGRCLSMKQPPLISVIYLLIWQIYSFSNEHEEGKLFFLECLEGRRRAMLAFKKKKKKLVTVMLYMCTYTCGIWDVITWIRVQQHLCKTGNHFQLQVGPEALVKVPLGSSIVV